MLWVRNLLISLGAFWLSRQLVVLMSLTVGRIANGVTYGESFAAAIAMGILESTGRAVCAALGAVIVTFAARGVKPHRWAAIVAGLYVVAAQPLFHWYRPPTTWDRVSRTANVLWPAFVCILTAVLIARLKRHSSRATSTEIPTASA